MDGLIYTKQLLNLLCIVYVLMIKFMLVIKSNIQNAVNFDKSNALN